jgi:hypothetical protein
MEGPALPWGIKNRHYAWHFTAHDDDDDYDDDDDDDFTSTQFDPCHFILKLVRIEAGVT